MKLICKLFLFTVLFLNSITFSTVFPKKDSFLVQKTTTSKRGSKNELKENIGEELKEALHACASIAVELGNLQKELGSLQKRLLTNVESLVENRRVFKKARQRELSGALRTMSKVKQQLRAQEQNVKRLSSEMNKSVCLKS